MASKADLTGWLTRIWWREAWLTLEAVEPAILPPYLGSTLRGALGHLLRASLCETHGCGHDCERPRTCRYYSLFEQDHQGAKPFLLLAPPPPGLEDIAMGGPINLPYRTKVPKSGETTPGLWCDGEWRFEPGVTLRFGLRLMGMASNALPAIIEAVARWGLSVGGAQFRLVSAQDQSGQILFDRRLPTVPVQMPVQRSLAVEEEAAKHIRIVFLSPTVFKLDRFPTFAPADFASRFIGHSIGRAVQMHSVITGVRHAWIEAPSVQVELAGHRLFHYKLRRHSFRQDKWMDFDGVVGYIDLLGELGPAMPWARAAEVLHFGQKAAFGLGKVRVLVLG